MRVKNHQKRAKVAFTKPFTTHLMRGKGDFSCRVKSARKANELIWNTTKGLEEQVNWMSHK